MPKKKKYAFHSYGLPECAFMSYGSWLQHHSANAFQASQISLSQPVVKCNVSWPNSNAFSYVVLLLKVH